MDGVARRRLVDHRADILQRFARLDVAARGIEPRLVQRLVEFGQHLDVRDVVGVIQIGRQDVGDHVRQVVVGGQFFGQEPSKGSHVDVAKGERPSPSRCVSGAPASAVCWRASSCGSLSSGESEAPSLIRRPTGASCWRQGRPQASQGPSAGRRTAPWVRRHCGAVASAREAVRRRSRAKIAEAYSVERMTRDTLSVYAEALAR